MTWWKQALGLEKRATQLSYDQIASMIDGMEGRQIAGLAVNDKTALQVATVLACGPKPWRWSSEHHSLLKSSVGRALGPISCRLIARLCGMKRWSVALREV